MGVRVRQSERETRRRICTDKEIVPDSQQLTFKLGSLDVTHQETKTVLPSSELVLSVSDEEMKTRGEKQKEKRQNEIISRQRSVSLPELTPIQRGEKNAGAEGHS